MFYQDFHVAHGVLNVDTTSLGTAHVPVSSLSASTKIEFSPAIYGPDLPPQPKPNYILTTAIVDIPSPPQPKNMLSYLQSSNQFASNLNGNNLFEANSAALVVMLSPVDAPPPNPQIVPKLQTAPGDVPWPKPTY